MFLEERHQEIIKMLQVRGKVLVKELSELFSVSEGMIRKDLQRLEKEGLLRRTYGGAIRNREVNKAEALIGRSTQNLSAKEKIANKAVKMLPEGTATVFIDSSSTNAIVAQKIAASGHHYRIITNMPVLATVFSENSACELFIIGGHYDKRLGAITGLMALEAINRYNIDIAFVGAAGVDLLTGTLTNFDTEEALTKQAIISAAKKVVIAAESFKLKRDGSCKFASIADVHAVICDEDLLQGERLALEEYGVEVL